MTDRRVDNSTPARRLGPSHSTASIETREGLSPAIIKRITALNAEIRALALDMEFGFLLDPRRLNVALSRAKQKMILMASRSVFTIFSTDEATFANAQIWKNLLRRTCTQLLWQGERDGVQVEVWGNAIESSKDKG